MRTRFSAFYLITVGFQPTTGCANLVKRYIYVLGVVDTPFEEYPR
jgi:hypothetical protein